MNTKKSKHKKPNKLPNPSPTQNLESEPKLEEPLQEIQPKSEVKDEIAKVVSEVVEAPGCEKVQQEQEIESDTPKKPKRNKGKKKKGQDDEFVEKIEDTHDIPKKTDGQEGDNKNVSKENITEEVKDPLDETAVVPSTRKKKNKKKNQEKNLDEQRIPEVVPEMTVPEEPKAEVIDKVDSEIKELFGPKPDTPKQDKKKKNKKKNRNDSERSDKSEDHNVLCTTAFNQLLAEDNNTKIENVIGNPELPTDHEMKQEVKVPETTVPKDKSVDEQKDTILEAQETKNPKEESKSKKKNKKSKHVLVEEEKTTKEENVIDSQELPIGDEMKQKVKETIVPEDKSVGEQKERDILESHETKTPKEDPHIKKKNKKDKKHLETETIEEPKVISQDIPTTIISQPLEKITSEELKQVLIEPMEKVLEAIEKEPSPKPKAKIAKPVEKKKKGKHDLATELSENILTGESSEMKTEKKKDGEGLPKQLEIKLEDVPILNIVKSQVPDKELRNILSESEKINIPTDNKMGKKRRKSPKPPKQKDSVSDKEDIMPEISQKIEPQVETIIKESLEIATPILMLSESKETLKEGLHEALNIDSEIEKQSSIKPSETHEMKQPQKEKRESVLEKIDDEGFELKTSKKKKKTPKLPAQPEIIAETIESEIKIDNSQVKSEPCLEEKIDVPLDLSFSSEIEVRSVRTDESEGSTCDATPEVLFIRSSSQQLFDNNNNTVIQELISVEEMKLDEPITIPLIERSGGTPISTPELISPGIGISEFEAKTVTDEKTDLKSKMMEVNQDMEELRLSIERSLAEFTAMDKGDQEVKKERDDKISHKTQEHTYLEKKEDQCKFVCEMRSDTKKDIPGESDIKEQEKLSLDVPLEATQSPPVCPARKDHKGKGKSKKKGKPDPVQATTTTSSDTTSAETKDNTKEEKQKTDKTEQQKSEHTQEKSKQKSANTDADIIDASKDTNNAGPVTSELPVDGIESTDFEPIENFEDALTSSIDDVNKTFEMIAKDADKDNKNIQKTLAANKPDINITEPSDDTDRKVDEKANPVSQPKNLLGHYDIPVQSNKTDYKKEKNKTPNARQAKVKIKDSMDVETKKQSKESQTDTKRTKNIPDKSVKETFSKVENDNEEYVYKYSFRKVFLQSACHICNKDLSQVRVPCVYCNLVFYCGAKHKDEDWPHHQALCFAVSTLAHMKDQKHIYADAQLATGQDYRLLRMQMIVSSEKVLKRRLVPWEQEALLYPRICADVACREWRQGKLRDCEGCGQVSYCSDHPEHLAKTHQRWCKSYSLYQKLVTYQQTKGRLEPRLPTRVMVGHYVIPAKMNEVLAGMYEEKIDMNDIQYAALTQLATAPLTTAYCLQIYRNKAGCTNTNGVYKKQPFTIHVVGAELQFEADALNKWEVFFLHLRPDVQELKVVLVSTMLNPGNLPLDLLAKIKLCENCRQNKRRVVFTFEDNKNYFEYRTSEDFINPDIICAFNPSIQRSSMYNGKDPWPASITSILRLKQPFIITSYTLNELRKDVARVKECTENNFKLILEPGFNSFASVRPDRNFISDDEMPLLFKNYCVAVIVGC